MYRSGETAPANNGSRTQTIQEVPSMDEGAVAGPSSNAAPLQGVLRLRGGHSSARRVVWTDDTVDNEGLGRKKSKICCIYHKTRAFDESSPEGSSSSDSGSDPDSNSSSSSLSSSRSVPSDGPSVIQSLREKLCNRSKGEDDYDDDEQVEGHDGGDGERCEHSSDCRHREAGKSRRRNKGKARKFQRTRRSCKGQTVTEESGPRSGGREGESEERPKRNAYELDPR